ncbi:MAG: FmdB family zinc ribbon protein [Rhodoferax sp.]
MPIYAYKCESCGFAKDVLQRMSDALLTDCPSCSASSFKKQLTSAGFQLKGSGWYATDFKGGAPATTAAETATPTAADSGNGTAATPEVSKPSESAPAKSVAATAAAATGGCAGGCACH